VSGPFCILVVDDEEDVRDLIVESLSSSGYEVLEAGSGAAMREVLAKRVPNLVLLDIGLPGEDGLSLARYLRERYDLGIIMVTGAGEVIDRIIGLEVGADDYLAKPFDPRELRARIKSVQRRYQRSSSAPADTDTAQGEQLRFGPYVLDLTAQRLDRGDEEIPLTHMEFELLKIFAERPNRVLTRDQILNLTQNRDWDPYDRSIDIRIARLRRKIETDPAKPNYIRTVRGAGYKFVPTAG